MYIKDVGECREDQPKQRAMVSTTGSYCHTNSSHENTKGKTYSFPHVISFKAGLLQYRRARKLQWKDGSDLEMSPSQPITSVA